MYIIQDELLWLLETAKKNGVSKEDFLMWVKETGQQGNQNADNKNV